jgi:hypothetical protein
LYRTVRLRYNGDVRTADLLIGEGLVLTEIELSAEVVHPGEAVQVRLTWGVQAPVGADYTVFLHALSDGEPRFQADRPPLEGLIRPVYGRLVR